MRGDLLTVVLFLPRKTENEMPILQAASIALVALVFPLLTAAQVRPQFEVAAIKPADDTLSGDFVLGVNARGSHAKHA